MSTYLITIAPDNGKTGGDSAHTTVRVDTSTGRTRITELTVRSASKGGLAPSDLPAIDMDLLIRALTATPSAQPLAVEPATLTQVGEASAAPSRATATPARRRGRKAAASAAPAKKASARKSAGRKATDGKATATKKAAATKATKTASRRVAATAAPKAGGTRAYRRMPEPEQVMDVYRQTGSIGGVAEHFGVPRHTVAGWARRLRGLGHTIGRQ